MEDPRWWGDSTISQLHNFPDIYFSTRDDVYYHGDEAEQLEGPFNTLQEAQNALAAYAEYLNTPAPEKP